VPVIATGAGLPAVPADRLDPGSLRRRFASPPAWRPEIDGDGQRFAGRTPVRAAVLVPLVVRDGGVRLLLTRRTEHLRDHAGQISFPGGRIEASDADAVAAALREAEEEVGLARDAIEVIGALPDYHTVTAFVVTPIVALVRADASFALDPFEVAEVFEVPLAFLMDPAHHRTHEFEFSGNRRRFLSMPWDGDGPAPCSYFIWGATAAMLRNLYRFLSA